MKIKNIFGGMICLALLASCGDEMDYHEYTNYDKDYVFTNFAPAFFSLADIVRSSAP